jgi:hypothetical protein
MGNNVEIEQWKILMVRYFGTIHIKAIIFGMMQTCW